MSSKPGSQLKDDALHEGFSPIKINFTTSSIGSNITNIPHHRTPQRIIHHPHGLAAKHDARRNTIGHNNSIKRRGLVNTPLVSNTSIRNPITSPRLVSREPINLESIKRTKQHIDKQIKLAFPDDNKENRKHLDLSSSDSDEPFSSPLKRARNGNHNHSENYEEDSLHPIKIPKISMNLTKEVIETKEVEEEDIEEDDIKEDKVKELIKEDFVERHRPTSVIDDIVDDDDEEEEEEEQGKEEEPEVVKDQEVQRFNPTLEHTQINKIIKEHSNDYVTPERMTEPVAKSPETHHNIRVIEEDRTENFENYKDNTSPSKRGNENLEDGDETTNLTIRQLENEPTINFLLSPNSKPVFSVNQVNKIQLEHDNKIRELFHELDTRDEKFKELSEQLHVANEKLLTIQKDNRNLTEMKAKFVNSEQLLTIQLTHIERELASLTKNSRIKDSSLNNMKRKLTEQKMLLDETQLENENLKNGLNDSQRLEDDLKAEIIDTNNSNIDMTLKLDQVVKEKEELWTQNQELIEKLSNSDSISNEKYEKLNKQYQELEASHESLINRYNELEETNKKLESDNELKDARIQKLKDDNSTNEKLMKEFDEVATAKIHEIEADRDQAQKECDKLEKTVIDYSTDVRILEDKLKESEHTNSKLQSKIDELEGKVVLEEELLELKSKLNAKEIELNDTNNELETKNDTIKDYLSKMDQLVNSVEALKQQNDESKKEKEKLAKELKDLQEKADAEWDRLAQHLHSEYSRKHIEKVRFLKESFAADTEKLAQDKKTLEREVEFLKAKIEKGNEEAKYLRERINSLNEHPSTTKLSPKVTSSQLRKRLSNN